MLKNEKTALPINPSICKAVMAVPKKNNSTITGKVARITPAKILIEFPVVS